MDAQSLNKMNFSSLREFFYKVYNICLLVMFMPIAVFLSVYYLLITNVITEMVIEGDMLNAILVVFPIVAIFILTIVHLLARKRFVKLIPEPSLGIRLEKYFSIAFLRIIGVVISSILMALGLFLTGSEYFTIYFLVLLIWLFFVWPTPTRVSTDLKLRGDEHKMVVSKGEAFK